MFIILTIMTNNEIRVRKCKDNLHSFSLYKCLALSVRHNFEKLRYCLFFSIYSEDDINKSNCSSTAICYPNLISSYCCR